MEIIRLHRCKRCGKIWLPPTPGNQTVCPTCKTTEAEPRAKNLLSSVSDYMDRMQQQLAKSDQTITNLASSMTIGEETMTNKRAMLELTERLANQGVLIGHA